MAITPSSINPNIDGSGTALGCASRCLPRAGVCGSSGLPACGEVSKPGNISSGRPFVGGGSTQGTSDQGGSGDGTHEDSGWGEQRGEQQAEQADATDL